MSAIYGDTIVDFDMPTMMKYHKNKKAYVMQNKYKIEEWGKKSRKYVEDYHNSVAIGKEYDRCFNELMNRGE